MVYSVSAFSFVFGKAQTLMNQKFGSEFSSRLP